MTSENVYFNKQEMRSLVMCGEPTEIAYPAMGGGWMALCECHGKKHLPHAKRIEELIRAGETFEGVPQ